MKHRPIFRREFPFSSLALALLLASTSFGEGPSVLTSSSDGTQPRLFHPPQYIPDRNSIRQHVALDLRFDWEHEELSGVETLVFSHCWGTSGDRAGCRGNDEYLSKNVRIAFTFDRTCRNKSCGRPRTSISTGRRNPPLVIEYHTNGPHRSSPVLVGAALRSQADA